MPSPTDKQAEVILAGCGAPKRGMGWYHAVQLLKGKCPSAVLCHVVEPWFLGGGTFAIIFRIAYELGFCPFGALMMDLAAFRINCQCFVGHFILYHLRVQAAVVCKKNPRFFCRIVASSCHCIHQFYLLSLFCALRSTLKH